MSDGSSADAAGTVLRAYRFALDPTVVQDQQLRSHCGAARFTFNHLLASVKPTSINVAPNAATVLLNRT